MPLGLGMVLGRDMLTIRIVLVDEFLSRSITVATTRRSLLMLVDGVGPVLLPSVVK
jgi:hypothetical protein